MSRVEEALAEIERLREALTETESERDMFRDKAHRFIALSGKFDATLGALVQRIEALIEWGERQSVMVVPTDALERVLSDVLGPTTEEESRG